MDTYKKVVVICKRPDDIKQRIAALGGPVETGLKQRISGFGEQPSILEYKDLKIWLIGQNEAEKSRKYIEGNEAVLLDNEIYQILDRPESKEKKIDDLKKHLDGLIAYISRKREINR